MSAKARGTTLSSVGSGFDQCNSVSSLERDTRGGVFGGECESFFQHIIEICEKIQYDEVSVRIPLQKLKGSSPCP